MLGLLRETGASYLTGPAEWRKARRPYSKELWEDTAGVCVHVCAHACAFMCAHVCVCVPQTGKEERVGDVERCDGQNCRDDLGCNVSDGWRDTTTLKC